MKIMKALEKLATAVTFAEAGEWDTALEVMHKEPSDRKILIAYEGDPADRRLIEYAIGVAERVKCDMLFAYVATRKKAEELTREYVDGVNNAFNAAFEHEVDVLKNSGRNVSAQQIVISRDFNEAVHSICREVKKIEFVILGCRESSASRLHLDVPYFFFK